MSLINEVLREVDQRQTAPPARSEPAAMASSRPRAGRRVMPLVLILLACAIPLAWLLLQAREDAPSLTESLPADLPMPAPSLPMQISSAPEPRAPDQLSSLTELPDPAPAPAPESTAQPDIAPAPLPASADSPARAAPEPLLAQRGAAAAPEPAAAADEQPLVLAAAEPAPEPAIRQQTPAAPPPVATPPPVAAPAQFSIRRAEPAGADSDAFIQAQRVLARGQQDLAEDGLRSLLARQPEHHEARHLLAGLFAASGRQAEAELLLRQGLELGSSAALAGLLGRVLAETGRIGEALTVLQSHAPPITAHLDYHLLHAALLRQAGRHVDALDQYGALTRAAPDSAAAWVGLGASHESLGQAAEARLAYQQALRLDQAELAAFARSRLRALN